jgi:hypothetical protein
MWKMNSRKAYPFKKRIRWGGQELDSRFNELDFLEQSQSQQHEDMNEVKVNPKIMEESNEPPLET